MAGGKDSVTALRVHRSPPGNHRRRRGVQKYRSMEEIMKVAPYAVVNHDELSHESGDVVVCQQCGSGDKDHELLLCDKCDKGYHMFCLRPIVARVPIGPWYCPKCFDPPAQFIISGFSRTKIIKFFMIKKCGASSFKRISPQDSRKQKRRSLVYHKKRRRLLPYVPSKDPDRRLQQMRSLASALTSLNLEFSDDLTYPPGMAPESANQAILEKGGIQVLSKKDSECYRSCRSMARRGEYPPLLIIIDCCEGFAVEADGPIKDMTLLAEYTGDVDYIKNRENDKGNSMMTLLLATDPDKSLVICPDKRANIARFFSGINNHIPESRKKKNVKCVRYNVDGVSRVLLVATRDIAKGERLYYDYNGYEHEYPTHDFV